MTLKGFPDMSISDFKSRAGDRTLTDSSQTDISLFLDSDLCFGRFGLSFSILKSYVLVRQIGDASLSISGPIVRRLIELWEVLVRDLSRNYP